MDDFDGIGLGGQIYDLLDDTGAGMPTDPGTVAGGGFLDLITYAGRTAVDTWRQTTLMQSNLQNQRFIEGQRMMQQRAQMGGIPPLYLLLGAGLLFVLMTRKG